MERRELVNTGMYTEKQAALNMDIITAVKAIQFGCSTKTLWLWRKRRCGKMRRK